MITIIIIIIIIIIVIIIVITYSQRNPDEFASYNFAHNQHPQLGSRRLFVVFLVGFQADIHFTNGNSNKALVLVNKALLRRD